MANTYIYYIAKWEGGQKNGNPVLFFPEYSANPGNIVCYAHMGQHSEACHSYYAGLKNCNTPAQQQALRDLIAEYEQRLAPGEKLAQVYRDKERYRIARHERNRRN